MSLDGKRVNLKNKQVKTSKKGERTNQAAVDKVVNSLMLKMNKMKGMNMKGGGDVNPSKGVMTMKEAEQQFLIDLKKESKKLGIPMKELLAKVEAKAKSKMKANKGGMPMKKKGYAMGGAMKKKGYAMGGAMPMGGVSSVTKRKGHSDMRKGGMFKK